jgi:signal transduction protein with GAF and PtsI domain
VNPHTLKSLQDFAAFVAAEERLDTSLEDLARRAAETTRAATCSIMLLASDAANEPRLKLWASTEALPASAWTETPKIGEGIVGRVLETGRPLLVADIGASEFAVLARRRSALGGSCMCLPIAIAGTVIGVMSFANGAQDEPFSESRLMVAAVLSALVARLVQVERLQTMLRSRVAQMTLAREGARGTPRLADGTAAPGDIAKMLAKSFYKDLAGAGFEPGQILEAASEIVAQISGDIARYKKRLGRRNA